MWIKVVNEILEALLRKVGDFQGHVDSAVEGVLTSQTRNESRYDTYREDFSREAAAADGFKQNYIAAADELRKKIQEGIAGDGTVEIGCIVFLGYSDGSKKIVYISSEQVGGLEVETTIGKIMVISNMSPLGEALIHQKKYHEFKLGKKEIVIARIQPGDDDHAE
ncbi:MAG: hypothetical protein WC227_03480 [Patescibacteria group bacterium]|jgi:transcription elongation GreA/GreB family factor